MKYILKTEKIVIPKGVTVTSRARVVTVKGPKGTVTKSFKHIKAEIIVQKEKDEHTKEEQNVVRINIYMNTYKQGAILYTLRSHISNMITGVTSGYRYKMHEVHKHFPIDLQVKDNAVNIIKYLGQRDVKVIPLPEGVSCQKNPKNPSELWFDGIDCDQLGCTCSKVFQSCYPKDKDIRKFLDGIFISERGLLDN